MIDTLRLDAAAIAAKAAEAATGLPAELTLAQWALESGWGQHEPGNNCFGIKTYPGDSGQQELMTCEVYNGISKRLFQWFATFPTLADCFKKHALLITQNVRYQMPWGNYQANRNDGMDRANAVRLLIAGVARIYATDPDYVTKLNDILAMPEVQSALEYAPAVAL